MREGEQRRRDFHETQETLFVRHILPKANEIVKTSEQVIKSIYPFDLVPPTPSHTLQLPFAAASYDSRPVRPKFTPPFSSIDEHFQKSSLLYDKFNLGTCGRPTAMNLCSIDKLKSLCKNDFIITVDKTAAFSASDSPLCFDSRFESGNLSFAAQTGDLHCLLLHNDINTTGYTNWFYFSVSSSQAHQGRFAIMNYGKAGWPMNLFPGICLWNSRTRRWGRKTCNVLCQANANLYSNCGQFQKFNTLYFQYDFQPQEKVFFAYNPPYTYTDLLKTLDAIEEQKRSHFHRKLAGTSLVGNRLEMLTITNFASLRRVDSDIPVVVIMARTHAGETVSSWIIHFLIKFLVSDSAQAAALRDAFVFKIFPMVNPDGVAHGNYRCSLIGRDLNRRWKNPAKQLYPQVYYIKNQILDTHQQRQIRMVLDLHGHTQKKRAFFYGCADRTTPHKARLFPYLASKISALFEFSSCNFAMEKSKEATARITLYNLIKSPEIFTIETSQFGLADKFLSTQAFQDIALTLCRCLTRFYKIDIPSQIKADIQECQEELMNSPALLKVGCDPSDGSDSQPSVCNLQFDRINKLAQHHRPRPLTQTFSPKRKSLVRPQSYKKAAVERKQMGMSVAVSREINEKTLSPTLPFRVGSSMSQKRQQPRNKVRNPNKLQFTKDVQSSLKLQQLGGQVQRRAVRMINFELLIDEGRRKSSLRQAFENADLRANHINYHMLQKRCVFRNRSFNWNKGSV